MAARLLLCERVEDFFKHRDKALKTADAEDIHDLRVASRRLREGLALFAPCYPAGDMGRLVRRLKRVTKLLGEIRNTDEAILFFATLKEELGTDPGEALEVIISSFREQRENELRNLRNGLKELAPRSLRDLCRRIVNAPSLFTSGKDDIDLFMPLARFARDALHARLDAVLELLPGARQATETEAQHLLRIAVKHFRYRMEILTPLLDPHYGEHHQTLKDYQDVLGIMHDLDVFAGIVRGANLSPPAEQVLLKLVAEKRDRRFADFSAMLETRPFSGIGEYLGRVL